VRYPTEDSVSEALPIKEYREESMVDTLSDSLSREESMMFMRDVRYPTEDSVSEALPVKEYSEESMIDTLSDS
jgi:hypothetical protein